MANYYLLHYDYVADILTKREPYRTEHLENLTQLQESNKLLLAGAVGAPVTGATFVFHVNSAQEVEQFIASDPYVANDLVTQFKIEPWTVVVGSAHQSS